MSEVIVEDATVDELVGTIAEIARIVDSDLSERDRSGTFAHAAWKLCGEAGLLRITVPTRHGGLGMGASDAVRVMRHFGRACDDAGLVFAVNSVLWSCIMPIVWFGSEDQREELLPSLCDGSMIAANAMTEPSSGSDAMSLQSVARPSHDGYVLAGEKTLISNAPIADLFLVYARSEDRPGPFGISVFLLDGDTPGLLEGPALSTMGLRTASLGSVRFEECRVARSRLLGAPGAGLAVFSRAMTWERGCVLAPAVGVMERQIERCVAHAQQRRRFGSAIGSFQAIAHRLADMRVRLDASRLLIERWAGMQDEGHEANVEASIAKLFVSESLIQSSMNAVEIFGGDGYLEACPAERELRDALATRIYGGTSEVQRNLIARDIGLT